MTGTIFAVRQRDSYSEVHFLECPVIQGQVAAGQLSYNSVVFTPIEFLENGTFLAKLAATGSEPRFQPCCVLVDEGEYSFPIYENMEEMAELILRAAND